MAIQKEVNVIISAVDRFSGVMSSFSGHWGMALGVLTATEAAIVALSVKLADLTFDIGKTFVASAADFHDAIYNVRAVAGEFGATAGQIDDVLNDLTIRFPITGKAAGEALQLIAQFGYSSEEQLKAVSDAAMTLHIATGEDLQNVLEGTITTLNAFGLGIEEIDRVINLFAASSFKSAADVGDMIEALKYAAPAASLAGTSLEDVVTVLAMLKDRGLEASQTGTSLRMMFAQLYQETGDGEDVLIKLGLTYKQVQESLSDFTKFIGLFEGKTLTAKDAVDLFGVRAQALAPILNLGTENFTKYRNSVTGTTAAYDAMAEKLKTWDVVQRQVSGSLDVFKKIIGEDLLPEIISLVGIDENTGIRGLITALTKLEESEGLIGGPLVEAFRNLKEASEEAFVRMFGDAEGFYDWLVNISEFLAKNLELVGKWGLAWIEMLVSGADEREELQNWLIVFNAAFSGLSLTIVIVRDALVILWEILIRGLSTADSVFSSFMYTALQGLKLLYEGFNLLPDWIGNFDKQIQDLEGRIGYWADRTNQDISRAFSSEVPQMWTEKVFKTIYDTSEVIANQLVPAHKALSEETKLSAEEAKRYSDYYGTVRDKLSDMSQAVQEVSGASAFMGNAFEGIDEEVLSMSIALNDTGINVEKLADGTLKYSAGMREAGKEVDKTKKKMSKLEKHELSLEKKQFEHDLKIVENKLKYTHEMGKAKLEWTAKIRIAEIEAGTKRLQVLAETTAASFKAVTENVGDLTAILAGVDTSGGFSKYWDIKDIIESQIEIQNEFTKVQTEMIRAQTDLALLQAKKISEEGLVVKVTMEGDTQGWLEGLLNSLLEEIFVRAQTESFSCFGV